ncbi:MAG: hypothetical protein JXB10_05055 [Pirellulales bacterium]|nr:hypothetical protein [Pirellulales bacterium]
MAIPGAEAAWLTPATAVAGRFFRATCVLAAAGLVVALGGCNEPAVIPGSYQTYNHPDGTFKIEYPTEWEAKGDGKGCCAWASFTSGGAEIQVDTSTAGSLVGDIARSRGQMGGGMADPDPQFAPVAEAHEHGKEGFEEAEEVVEQESVPIVTGLGDGRKSEYTGSSTFGGKKHGYRATALARDYQIRVICECPESEWESLKPAFDKVIESLSQGRPER